MPVTRVFIVAWYVIAVRLAGQLDRERVGLPFSLLRNTRVGHGARTLGTGARKLGTGGRTSLDPRNPTTGQRM